MIDNNGFPKKFEEIKNFVYLPFDFVFHFYMAIPKTLKKKEVFEYVLHRLPKIYPGNISEIEIDIRPSTTIAEIFIIARDSLSKIREQNGDKKFTSLISILQPLTNSFIRIIVFDNWYEKAEYIDGRWTNFSSNSYDDFSFL
ncbi:MAG: hypothetical protein JXL85_05325, partial [Bacilli bacterium]|nr:hypothetical protein [Bacilli bacterium]